MSASPGYQPNLLSRHGTSSRLFLLVIIGVPVVLVGVLFGLLTRQEQTASLNDSLGNIISSPSASPRSSDSILSDTAATGLAQGIHRDTVRWFDQHSGRAYEGDLRTGAVRIISGIEIPGFVDGIWVAGEEQAFHITEDARTGRRYQFHDYRTDSGHIMNGVSSLSVSQDGKNIVYSESVSADDTVIRVARIDGTDPRTVFRTRLGIADLAWRDNDTILLTTWKPGTMMTDLVSLSLDGSLTKLLSTKEYLEFLVSRQGSVLATYTNPTENVVEATLNPATDHERTLSEHASARKCAWAPDGASLFCGVPRDANTRSGAALSATDDRLMIIDAETGFPSAMISTPEDRVGVYSPVISSSGTRAAFIDLFDGRVHVVNF